MLRKLSPANQGASPLRQGAAALPGAVGLCRVSALIPPLKAAFCHLAAAIEPVLSRSSGDSSPRPVDRGGPDGQAVAAVLPGERSELTRSKNNVASWSGVPSIAAKSPVMRA